MLVIDFEKYKVGIKFVWMFFVFFFVEFEKVVMFFMCGFFGDKIIVFIIDMLILSYW